MEHRKLKISNKEIEKIAEFISDSVQGYIMKKVPKKEILDFQINVDVKHGKTLDINVDAELYLNPISRHDPKTIIDNAIKHVYKEIDKYVRKHGFEEI
ncbi:conserved hypothetical protein [Methanothermus fervidus DSM 2088]|uniref:DUF3194 domain-containing protein n=1 Tax=Methanothermus fervidus (strain ATCC 43054 / DSM 2088 / JCM 10308 / V24 S) TaxID=523846 RepID=E3GWX3_METFV|nr:DUF3194 domain-containing protein [Methanothermus fervidus]ADP76862.1 conserved hypothetical protein [Methanothermus fervidus DSM 2088]